MTISGNCRGAATDDEHVRCQRQASTLGALLRHLGAAAALSACAAPGARDIPSFDWEQLVHARGSLTGDTRAALMWRREVCKAESLEPEHARLDAADLVHFLERRGVAVRVERPRSNLSYLTLLGSDGSIGPRLRVASLRDADAAARELGRAVLQHGEGSWGVYRGNLAVLGPKQDLERILSWMAWAKLPCWGVTLLSSGREVLVIPGGYRQL